MAMVLKPARWASMAQASPVGAGADHDYIGGRVCFALTLRTRKGIWDLLGRPGNLFGHQISSRLK